MAPIQTRKRKSEEMVDPEPSTPTGSPTLKRIKMTQQQKTAVLENLRLEITERTRQMRAQYNLQCADLRSRIERRINRVPMALRNMKMGDLIQQHAQKRADEEAKQTRQKNVSSVAATQQIPERTSQNRAKTHAETRKLLPPTAKEKKSSPVRKPMAVKPAQPVSKVGRKRKSSAIHIPSDSENHETDPDQSQDNGSSIGAVEALPVAKNNKRMKPNNTIAKRVASKAKTKVSMPKDEHRGVLSPRSHNSRTLPQCPVKDLAEGQISPSKQHSRPGSPLKHASPAKPAPSMLSTISAMAKRGAQAAGLAPADRANSIRAMLPPPMPQSPRRPVLTSNGSSVTNSFAGYSQATTQVATAPASPMRTASQATNRSEESNTTNSTTIVKKNARGAKAIVRKPVAGSKSVAATAAAGKRVAASQVIKVSESIAMPLSPKVANTSVKRNGTVSKAASAVTRTIKKTVVREVAPAPAPAATGRVLRKRN